MKIIISLSLFLAPLILYSQEDSKIVNEIDSLKRIKNQLEIDIQTITNRIKSLEEKRVLLQFEKTESYDYNVNQKLQIRVRDKDNSSGKVIYEPRNGETLRLLDYNIDSKCWTVSIKNIYGYVNEVFLQNNPQIDEFKNNIILIKSKNEAKQKKAREQLTKQEMINKYGATNADKIARKQYWIGMTDEMARASLGDPTEINRTVGSWGVHEQWVYDKLKLYLYFENGTMTSFQN